MQNLYVVTNKNAFSSRTWRVGPLHNVVFDGILEFQDNPDDNMPLPYTTNRNRQPLHVIRSGRFIPDFFGTTHVRVVSRRLREKLGKLKGIEFNRVVFEHVVDLEMPPLGDFSWLTRDDILDYDSNPANYMKSLPHCPALCPAEGAYSHMLVADIRDLEDNLHDVREVTVNFGSYHMVVGPLETAVKISPSLFEKNAIVHGSCWVFREDAFAILAPYLNLDYHGVAIIEMD